MADEIEIPPILPLMPLKDLVIFPEITVPLSVSREFSILAVDAALNAKRVLLLSAQEDWQNETPGTEGIHRVGTAVVVMRMLKLPDGRIRILVKGLSRARIVSFTRTEPYFEVEIELIPEREAADELHGLAFARTLKQNLARCIDLGKNISPDVKVAVDALDDCGRISDLVAANLDLKLADAQNVLELDNPDVRARRVNELLTREINLQTMQREISSAAQGEMNKSQRAYFLRMQRAAIRDELDGAGSIENEADGYRARLEIVSIDRYSAEQIEKQIRRMSRLPVGGPEMAIVRAYVDWATTLPWNVTTADRADLPRARTLLDEEHYGLEDVKERILEYLAVRKLRGPEMRGQTLCLVGPPGVGKTSLGRAIARALDRSFARISLGGMRDEAEIRGHRRTYVGALPGRVLQAVHQARSVNPVIVLDEIDKLGFDSRGNPASALLEVLDPEQNASFADHYLELPFDLSKVIFVATANDLAQIKPAMLDRMEIVEVTGYTDDEKLEIAKRHLIPRQMELNGIADRAVEWTDAGIRRLIREYTNEAGLRTLQRSVAAVCRRIALHVAEGDDGEHRIDDATLPGYLGRFLLSALHDG